MDYRTLKATYFERMWKLDKYFDVKLMEEPRAKANLESYKDDLMQDLAVEVWANYNESTYESYNETAFIWLKAEKVWIAFIRQLERQTRYKSDVIVDSLHEKFNVSGYLSQFESRDSFSIIQQFLKPEEFELLKYKAQGYTFKEIFELTNFPSADAAKMKFNRIKKYIQQRFRRPEL